MYNKKNIEMLIHAIAKNAEQFREHGADTELHFDFSTNAMFPQEHLHFKKRLLLFARTFEKSSKTSNSPNLCPLISLILN